MSRGPERAAGLASNVWLLIAAQMLAQTAAIALVATSALVAFELADNKALATLPVALSMVTGAALMVPASLFMQRFGRRPGFALGATFGIASGLVAALALWRESFLWFALANMLAGGYQAFAQYYRFAATEAVSVERQARVLSLVISGGIVAAFAGPTLARLGERGGVASFIEMYLTLAALAVVAMLLLSRLRLPLPLPRAQRPATRATGEILRQPVFLTALAGSGAGFIVMTTIMSSTPLAMQLCGLPLTASATVIQWHMLGMFVPSLFVGDLIRRFGVLQIMTAGALIVLLQIAINLNGISYGHFIVGLTLLGVGWNFLFIGGSTLLLQAWRPGEQGRVQAAHDFVVFGLGSIGSFASGALLTASGWNAVNVVALPLLVLALIMIARYWRRMAFAT